VSSLEEDLRRFQLSLDALTLEIAQLRVEIAQLAELIGPEPTYAKPVKGSVTRVQA